MLFSSNAGLGDAKSVKGRNRRILLVHRLLMRRPPAAKCRNGHLEPRQMPKKRALFTMLASGWNADVFDAPCVQQLHPADVCNLLAACCCKLYIVAAPAPRARVSLQGIFPTACRGRIAPPVFFLSKETRYWLLQALEGAQNIVRQGNPHKFWFLGVQPVFWRNTLAPGGEMHHMGDTFWGKSRTKASFSHLPLSDFEGSLARNVFLRVSRRTTC